MFRFPLTVGALIALAVFTTATPASAQSCSATNVRCVDDTGGSTQEYSTIQAAVNAAQPGDTVLVYDGTYVGIQVTKSGTATAQIVIVAQGSGAVISTASPSTDGIMLSNVSYVTVQGFRIQNMPHRCVSGSNSSPTNPMKGLVVRGILCTNAGHEGLYLSEVSNSLVEGNTVTGSGADGLDRGHGIYLANAGSDNTTLRGNIISGMHGFDSAGIHMNGDLSIGGDGLISGVVLEGNVIFNGDQNGVSMDGVQDTTIRNNVIYSTRNAIRGFQIDGAAGPKNMKVINNTFIAASGWAAKFSEDLGGHVIFNNILLGSSGSISVNNTNVTSDYNAVVDKFSRDNDSSTISLASWKSGGDDTHSMIATSAGLFVNPSANDYHRKDGSVAVDAGQATFASVAAPAVDFDGTPRPAGAAFDLGAYETSAAGGTTPLAPRAPTNLRIIR